MRISVGKSRKDINWQVKNPKWEQLCQQLSETTRTRETLNEYKQMKQDERGSIKDIGGFVGGVVKDGRRRRENIVSRSLITLDADYAKIGMWDEVTCLNDFAMCAYSTHTHQPQMPRLRFVIPLDREVSPEEFEPISRRIAADFGIEQFDTTTHEPGRLMYWPSTSQDAEFVFKKQDGPVLSANAVLARYTDWKNVSEWPVAAAENTLRSKSAKALGDPEGKPGTIGLFCRCYNVDAAIEAFLPEIYTPTNDPTRYTFVGGSTHGGMVTYEHGKFAFSHHSTDPAGQQLCNAFDLVRLHMFSDLDFKKDPETPINKLPSFVEMQKFASGLDDVKLLAVEEMGAEARADFAEEEDEEVDPNLPPEVAAKAEAPAEAHWTKKLKFKPKGGIDTLLGNVRLIIENDPRLTGKIRYNEFTRRRIAIGLPWVKGPKNQLHYWDDVDDANLACYVEEKYELTRIKEMLEQSLAINSANNSYHPVREFLAPLVWDGVERLETLFINYMGVEDSVYTRTVTKKWFTAAVKRVMEPGCKFDHMIVLVGTQGSGKSTFARLVSKTWSTDTAIDWSGNKPMELLQGKWIVEMAELSNVQKRDVEQVKAFVSSTEDTYRPAYAKHIQTFPRQCVFFGTTNDASFLRDRSGNRRFWPLTGTTTMRDAKKIFTELTDDAVNQIWAEAKHYYEQGYSLFLDDDMSEAAAIEQEAYLEHDEWLGIVEAHLNRMLPAEWPSWPAAKRKDFTKGFISPSETFNLTYQRQQFSLPELMWELYDVTPGTIKTYDVKEYHNRLRALKGWQKSKLQVPTENYGSQIVYTRLGGDELGV